ncbi:hypothetical protein MEI_00006 [Bartonella vinsonii subsp. arupensis Pm136co]|uniref:DUF3987 domain-containing protein n=1 Tax=Bartonella vinsonii subsp. arupensis Pm136co TaxID=1094561 RepID=A0ABN0GRW5_BARVI|nr:YfjI family protein [Bartonella vinsonii]EJF98839.1 hypothetical protein MEI_00006 [Bartonella vinsonii subsp. arupensis Pm136co]
MKQDVQNNNDNTSNDNDHNNDNVSLKNYACLQAIPYEQTLQQMGWGEIQPISNALLPVKPFQATQVPTALGRYIYDIADHQQSPVDFVAISAVCALAAVVGNGVRIAPKQHSNNWKIVPNLWGMIIGQPSARKTPALQAALEPVNILQKEWDKNWTQQKEQAEIEEYLEILDKQEKKKQARKALKEEGKQAARAILLDNVSKKKQHDDCFSRLVVNDVTVEKLGELLKENPRGLLMVRDELSGFLANLELKEYQTDRGFYLQSFNGDQPYTYDRIGRGTIHIPNATLSIIGGIQPLRITPLIRALHSGKGDDGLIQRFQMMVWPDKAKKCEWVDRDPLKDAYKDYEEVFRSFRDKPLGSPEHPIVIRFSPKAQEAFREWWENFQREISEGNHSEPLQAHLAKMDKTIPSLALIFELIEGGRFEITLPSLSMALRWSDYLLSHAKRLYAAGDTLTAERAKLIVERCDGLPEVFTARDIYRRCWAHLKDKEAVKQALELLCCSNHIRKKFITHQTSKLSTYYEWHPLVKNENTKQ